MVIKFVFLGKLTSNSVHAELEWGRIRRNELENYFKNPTKTWRKEGIKLVVIVKERKE